MNFGKCVGGPFDGLRTAHPEPTMRLAIDKETKRVNPAVIAGAGFDFGIYRWDGKQWHWNPPAGL